jgi:hypothetical protein
MNSESSTERYQSSSTKEKTKTSQQINEKRQIAELDQYALKRMQIEKINIECDKKKYDVLLSTLMPITFMTGKKIKYLSDFRNISCDRLHENFKDIKDIFEDDKDKLENAFGIKIEFHKVDDHKKIIHLIRKMANIIDYKVTVRNNYITIAHA